MKRTVPVEKTFAVIRTLQPEIDFLSIQQFVMQQPLPAKNYFKWLNPKNFLPMFTITSAIAATLILTHPFSETKQQAVIPATPPAKHEVILPAVQTPPPVVPMDTPVKKKVTVNAKKKTVAVSTTPASSATPESTSTCVSASTSATASSNAVVTIGTGTNCITATASRNGDSTEVVLSNGDGSSNISVRMGNAPDSKCNCNFGSEQDWINSIIEELKKQSLVTDDCDYQFTLKANAFSVNGKDISDEKLINQVMSIYESATGNRLQDDKDYISVKVSKEHCSFSKSFNK